MKRVKSFISDDYILPISSLTFRAHSLRDILRLSREQGISPDIVPAQVVAYDDDSSPFVDPDADIRVSMFDRLSMEESQYSARVAANQVADQKAAAPQVQSTVSPSAESPSGTAAE